MWTYNYTDELYHFGVKGQRWGVRRAYKKQLNKLDQSRAKHFAKQMRSERQEVMISKKLSKNHSAKNVERLKKAKANTERAKKNIKDVERDTDKLLAKIKKEGYTVDSKEVIRNGEVGKTTVQMMLMGRPGRLAAELTNLQQYGTYYRVKTSDGSTVSQTPTSILGRRYKVSN